MLTSKLYRAARTANRIERATRNPGRYAKQRAKSKALGALGFWRLMNKVWRILMRTVLAPVYFPGWLYLRIRRSRLIRGMLWMEWNAGYNAGFAARPVAEDLARHYALDIQEAQERVRAACKPL